MRVYYCGLCSDPKGGCKACVLDKTPEDFDKSTMDVLCRRLGERQPLWILDEKPTYYETI